MMLTIHGLSPKTRYQDLKQLIKQECGIDDFILDNLLDDNNGLKKVRVGLPDDNEGFKLMKCLDGYRTPGNYLLQVTQVGKPAVNANRPQEGFNPRPGYPQQRDVYPNQPRNDYNRGPQGPVGIQGPSVPFGPGGQQGRMDTTPSPWSSNNNTSQQWAPNSSVTPQIPQNRFNFGSAQHNVTPSFTQQNPSRIQVRPEFRSFDQGRQGPQSGQNYGGYAPETNLPAHQMDTRKNLRTIETVVSGHQASGPLHAGRYPDNQQYQPDKPITILKDNFQGPTQYNLNHPGGHTNYAQQNSSQWEQPSHQAQQSKPISKGGPYERPFEGRNYPQGQVMDPKDLQSRPDPSKDFDKRRGFSPSARDVMPRRISPSRGKDDPGFLSRLGEKRRISPGRMDDMNQRRPSPVRISDVRDRRVSPPGRREDIHGRRFSPSEKRMSPGGRRHIGGPGPRHETPPRRMSPSRRQISPGRRDDDRRPPRFSPNRHHVDKIPDKYEQDKTMKKVRPAYEPVQSHAQNEAMYSGGFRPKIQEKVQYSGPGMRQEQPMPWQRHREEPIINKQEHERMDERMPVARGRGIEKVENHYTPKRKSRSPNRRDRSPIRDRYKRISRSPRSSHSPRRSWALEKRSSPDAPPPPMWPGQSDDNSKTHRHNFPEKDVKPVHQPVWESRSFKDEELRNKLSNDRRQYEEAKMRIAKDLERNPQGSNQERSFQKFPPSVQYDEHRENYRGRDLPHQKIVKEDVLRRHRDEGSHADYSRGRTSPYRDTRRGINSKEFDKDLEDIYQRALQFKKKTEELKKSAAKKGDEFEDNRRLSAKDRDTMQQRYDDRPRHHGAESQLFREREERHDDKPRDERALRDGRLRDDRLRDERPRLDGSRDDRPRDDRLREDRPRDYRPKDDSFRDDKLQAEIKQHFDDARSGFHSRDAQQEGKKNIDDSKPKRIFFANKNAKQKRDRAVNEIAEKILERSEEYKHIEGDYKRRLLEELNLSVARIIYDMFGDSDISFIEVVIKYQAKYNLKDEENLLREVIQSLPQSVRNNMKRHSKETSDHPTKISRYTESSNLNPVKRRVPTQSVTRPAIIEKRPILKPRPRPPPPKPILTKPRDAVKELPKKQEDEKMDTMPSVDPPSTDKAYEGNYELNELMTKMVDSELDDIMPKVQEELSDLISSQKGIFECDAVIRKTTDGLRNVLGLNLTKRLLNVYNSLYVKIKFHGQPNKENLREFLQKYRFRSFARKSVNIFVAKLRNIEDFDNLFSGKEVRCGPVKITVSPVYSFTTCPPNLVTKYARTSEEEETIKSDNDIANDDVKPSVIDDKETISIKPSPTKPAELTTKKTESVDTVNPKNNTSKTEENASTDITKNKEPPSAKASEKTAPINANKIVSNNTTPQKSASETSKTIKKTAIEDESIKLPQKATVTPQKSTNTASTAVKTAANAAETSQKPANRPKATASPQKSINATVPTQSIAKPASSAIKTQQSTATTAKSEQSTNTTTKTQLSTNTAATTQQSTNTAATTQQSINTASKTQQTTTNTSTKTQQSNDTKKTQQSTNTVAKTLQSTNTAAKTQQSTNTAAKTQQSTNTAANTATKTQQSTNITTKTQQLTNTTAIKTQQSPKPATTAAATLQKSTSVTVTTQKSTKPSANTTKTPQKSAKSAPALQKSPKSAPTLQKSTKSATNDYDELDDHDILALISQGIVLDECGSEED